jgi:hypothetical protein
MFLCNVDVCMLCWAVQCYGLDVQNVNIHCPRNLIQNILMFRRATSRKVAGSRPDEMNGFFSSYLILLAALGPGVYSASNRNEYQKQKDNVSGE